MVWPNPSSPQVTTLAPPPDTPIPWASPRATCDSPAKAPCTTGIARPLPPTMDQVPEVRSRPNSAEGPAERDRYWMEASIASGIPEPEPPAI